MEVWRRLGRDAPLKAREGARDEHPRRVLTEKALQLLLMSAAPAAPDSSNRPANDEDR